MRVESGRIAYWDNLKAFLIFCVVLGHMILPGLSFNTYMNRVYCFLWLFHVPAFVFVSGYFSKGFVEGVLRGKIQTNKIAGYLMLYVLFKIALDAIPILLRKPDATFGLLRVDSAPWYLLSMVLWLLVTPFFARIGLWNSLIITMILGVIMPTFSIASDFLSIGRTVAWLPFFITGYYFKQEWVEIVKAKKRYIVAAIIIVSVAAVLVAINNEELTRYLDILYSLYPYRAIDMPAVKCITMKSCFYIVEAVLIFAICVICPSKKLRISFIGERTLPIYIGHRIIREFLVQCGFYKGIEWNNLLFSGFCLISSVFLVILFSAESFNRITRLPFHCFTRNK